MRDLKFAIIIVLAVYLATSLGAAEPNNPAPPSTSVGNGGVLRTFDTDSYVLRIGDKLEIFVTALPELPSIYEVRVDGNFFHPVAGQVKAAGRTLSDIRSDLAQKLAKELRYPQFRVGLQAITTMEVSVLGEAKSQGAFEIGAGGTALDALAKAGGLTDKADSRTALILRGSDQIVIALDPTEGQGLTRLQAGDVLYIKPGLQVSVAGEVSKPGPYTVSQGGGTPWDAIIAAGGAKEEAALTRVKLIRPSFPDPLVLDLSPSSTSGLPDEAKQLQAGDIIVVPARSVAVLGAATKPGPTPLQKEDTLLDVLSQQLTSDSDLKHILVVRAEDVQKNRDKKEEYDVNAFFKEGKNDLGTVPIHDGDLVYIPSKSSKGGLLGGNGFSSILSILGIARIFF